ncbi:MAG: DUF362 domain-containing protein [Archaeoglobaceae archaeon]|nr:DUF362 domain-containing protein [Archaeoglobaceae archaeon]MDW7989765.1 DUF362 domain-containing protein [Archaeoglobaceae archaeon]
MDVFYVDSRAKVRDPDRWFQPSLSLVSKLKHLLEKSPILDFIRSGDIVAVKTHFGDRGTTKTLRSQFIRAVVEKLLDIGAKPFVTETTGLGLTRLRCSALGRLQIAEENGYTHQTLKAPIIIADGLLGFDFVEVTVDGKYLKKVYVAKAIAECDAIVFCTHFKLHMQSGIGGSIKNVGVGCVAKPSKYDIHIDGFPEIIEKRCTKCNKCIEICPSEAIVNYRILREKCLKCAGCYEVCDEKAVKISWLIGKDVSSRIVECAKAVYKLNKNLAFLNFLVDITPHCDCHPYSDNAVVSDFGILASKDMVSVDRASYDIYKSLPSISDILEGEKFWTWTDPESMLDYAEHLGLGEQKYRLLEVD